MRRNGDLAGLADASDEMLLGAVLAHYSEALRRSDAALRALGKLGVDGGVASTFGLGFCDRTFGLSIPDSQRNAGRVIRGRLGSLGVLLGSGHETLRGCVVVPVVGVDGGIGGLYGWRVDGRGERFCAGFGGAIFNAAVCKPGAGELVVAGSIPDALAIWAAGHRDVVAPGRPQGFDAADRSVLVAAGRRLVLVGDHDPKFPGRLVRAGADVASGVRSAAVGVLGRSSDRRKALRGLLDTATTVAAQSQPAPLAVPEARGAVAAGSAAPPGGVGRDVQPAGVGDELFVETGGRRWRVRGACGRANLEGQLLRVAVSVTDPVSGRFHLDTLDLYSARQRRVFLDAAADELHGGRDDLAVEFADVLRAAETARDCGAHAVVEQPAMSDGERAEAEAFLAGPDLLGRVASDLQALGVVGERDNLLLGYLACVSRLCERPVGALFQSASAAGKSTLAEAVCSLVPPEHLVSVSALTAQALYYLNGRDLVRKVLCVAEERGAQSASYALKLLVSEGRLEIAAAGKDRRTGRLSTASYQVAGPVALVMTTTATDIDPELENRLLVLGVGEDPEQTKAVLAAQRQAATLDGILRRHHHDSIRRRHHNAQRLLRPFPVVIGDLPIRFPAESPRRRRDHAKLLSVISAVTLLHQHQRAVSSATTDDGVAVDYLEATHEDVEQAVRLAEGVVDRRNTNLGPQAARLLAAVETHVARQAHSFGCDPQDVPMTRRELRETLGWSDTQIRAATERLVAAEHLVADGGGRGKLRTYRYVASPTTACPIRPPTPRTSQRPPPAQTPNFAGSSSSSRHNTAIEPSDVAYTEPAVGAAAGSGT